MELSNFSLIDKRGNIEIEAMGEVWNLHDAYYLGLGHSFLYDEQGFVASNQVQLSWQVDPASYSAAGSASNFTM